MPGNPLPYPPIQVAELLRAENLWNPKSEVGTLVHLLLATLKSIGENRYEAVVLNSHLPGSEFLYAGNTPWKQIAESEYKVIVEASTSCYDDMQLGEFQKASLLFVHNAYYESDNPITIRLSPSTLLVNWEPEKVDQDVMIELFSGGFGGWKYAQRFLQSLGFPKVRTIGVEMDEAAAVQYALSHATAIVTPQSDVPLNFLHTMKEDVVFVENIQSQRWQQLASTIRPASMTMSAPCPSWSSASKQLGLEDSNGQAFVKAWVVARKLQPEWIGVEQVCGFKSHPHYETVLRVAQWAGYRLIEEKVIELAEIAPVKRPRWLAIFARQDVQAHQNVQWKNWVKWLDTSPLAFGSFDEMPDWECRSFEPTVEVATQYMDSALLPGPMRPWTPQEILAFRIPGPFQKQPVFLAAYGRQHELPAQALLSGGLLGFFTRQQNTFRWWSPWEQSMLHLQSSGIVMLKPARLSWQLLGNMISIPHATLLLANMHFFRGIESKITFSEIFIKLRASRYTVQNAKRLQDDHAWYLGVQGEGQALQKKTTALFAQLSWQCDHTEQTKPMMLPNTWWHPDAGLQIKKDPLLDLPMKIEYRPTEVEFVEIHLKAVPGNYGVYYIQSEHLAHCIRAVWDGKLLPEHDKESYLQELIIDKEHMNLVLPNQTKVLLEDEQEELGRRTILLIRHEKALVISDVNPKDPWQKVLRDFAGFQIGLQDQYGEIPLHTVLADLTLLHVGPPPLLAELPLLPDVSLLHDLQIEKFRVPHTDILRIKFKGSPESLSEAALWWKHSLTREWQVHIGRDMIYQDVEEDEMQFLFHPIRGQEPEKPAATPVTVLQKMIPVRLLQTFLKSLTSTEEDAVVCIFKVQGRTLAQMKMPAKMPFRIINAALNHRWSHWEEE